MRVLLVSYVFPPEPSPGSARPSFIARYLPRFGWDVTVLTHSSGTPPFKADVEHAGDVLNWVGRLPFRVQDALLVPDATARWIPRAVARGRELLSHGGFDALLSTALPATVHLTAAALAKEFSLPWLADYRDPWTGSLYVRRPFPRSAFERAMEKRALCHARAITTVSEPIAQQLRALHPGKSVTVIPNAVDAAEWEPVRAQKPDRFDLVYTGSMYDGKRKPDILFAALAAMRAAGDAAALETAVHFYGPNSGTVPSAAAAYGLTECVHVHGLVPRADAMSRQRSAAALLIFLNTDPKTAGELGSKVLEYAGARRPIVAFGPPGSAVGEFLTRHRLGWFASTPEQAAAALRSAYEHFTSGSPDVQIDSRELPSATALAERFAYQLDSITRRRGARPAVEAS